MSLTAILVLYLGFRLKQLTGDFLLSSWSAKDKNKPLSQGGLRGLSLHAGIHAACAFVVLIVLAPAFWWLAVVDFFVHFAVDRGKAWLNTRMGWTYSDDNYWRLFGIDQEAHNLTHLSYIVYIVMKSGGCV